MQKSILMKKIYNIRRLFDNSGVTSGICKMDEQDYLIGVDETHNILKRYMNNEIKAE